MTKQTVIHRLTMYMTMIHNRHVGEQTVLAVIDATRLQYLLTTAVHSPPWIFNIQKKFSQVQLRSSVKNNISPILLHLQPENAYAELLMA